MSGSYRGRKRWAIAVVAAWCAGFAAAQDAVAEDPSPSPRATPDGGDEAKPVEVVELDVLVDAAAQQPPFEGWGTSLCWWAHDVGDWPKEELDQLLDWVVDPKDGLGYTLFRYNIGGGDARGHDHMRKHGDVPGFRAGPDAPYDWTQDADQRRVMLELAKRVDGAVFEAFSNSPPYWMTRSGCASGNEGGASNLREDMFDAFAAYLADVAAHYGEEWDIQFRTVDPLNEPNANWWTAGHNQEGCHFSVTEQDRIIQALRKALDERGLNAMQVSAPDTNSIDACVENLAKYEPATIAAIGQINTHSYFGDKRAELRAAATRLGKRLWQSETGPLSFKGSPMDAALLMAERVVTDLNVMQPAAWLEWQVVSGGNWGCIHYNPKTRELRRSPTFYAYAAFTRAIRPGDRVLTVESAPLAAAVALDGKTLSLVAVNRGEQLKRFCCRLRGFGGSDPGATQTATATQAFGDADTKEIKVHAGTLTFDVAPRSVVTVRVSGVQVGTDAAGAKRVGKTEQGRVRQR